MEFIELVVVIAVAITFSNIFSKVFPKIPIFFVQIFLGILLGMTEFGDAIGFEPEIFLVMIIAPLLFREGEKADIPEIIKHGGLILFLAFGGVIFTLVAVGWTLHTLLPGLPLAACFAFGAALGPTDAVAVGSLAKRLNLPNKAVHILEGEGLLNDASGVTAFQFAVAALVTGTFSLVNASVSLLLSSIGGALVGFIVIWCKRKITQLIEKASAKDVTAYLLIELLLPFVAYLLAEVFHFSGIIAAVVAGVVQSWSNRRVTLFNAELATVSENTWRMIVFTLNALVFLFLGIELSQVFSPVWSNRTYENGFLFMVICILAVMLFFIRFCFISLFYFCRDGYRLWGKQLREILLLTFGGVKGTVSLATIFILPVVVNVLDPQERALLLFLTACVILVTLVIGMVVLPLLADGEVEATVDASEMEILTEVMQRLTTDLDKHDLSEKEEVALEAVVSQYDDRAWELYAETLTESQKKEIQELEALMLSIEQAGLDDSYVKHEISPAGYRMYTRFIDHYQKSFKGQLLSLVSFWLLIVKQLIRALLHPRLFWQRHQNKEKARLGKEDIRQIKEVFLQNDQLIEQSLKTLDDVYDPELVGYFLKRRQHMLQRLNHYNFGTALTIYQDSAYNKQLLRGYYLERKVIDEFEVADKIDNFAANNYRQQVNLLESYALSRVNGD